MNRKVLYLLPLLLAGAACAQQILINAAGATFPPVGSPSAVVQDPSYPFISQGATEPSVF